VYIYIACLSGSKRKYLCPYQPIPELKREIPFEELNALNAGSTGPSV
jgi:hypothetical protein